MLYHSTADGETNTECNGYESKVRENQRCQVIFRIKWCNSGRTHILFGESHSMGNDK